MRYGLLLPLFFLFQAKIMTARAQSVAIDGWGPEPRPAVPAAAYRATLRHYAARRERLAAIYRRATTPSARAACLQQARQLLLTTLDSVIFPTWEGTTWGFYGTTREPQQGQIACGYFVTTTLHDVGLRLERDLLAKQYAEVIVKNLVPAAHIHRYRDLSLADFVRRVAALGPGLYLVGLDLHVGFLRVRAGEKVQFVHSAVVAPGTVVLEDADTSIGLLSRYRVVGKLSANDNLLRDWLLQRALPARGATVTK